MNSNISETSTDDTELPVPEAIETELRRLTEQEAQKG
jgi:hypothetical protein